MIQSLHKDLSLALVHASLPYLHGKILSELVSIRIIDAFLHIDLLLIEIIVVITSSCLQPRSVLTVVIDLFMELFQSNFGDSLALETTEKQLS